MSKAIREAEKRAREREEAKRKTMLKYYEPLPSPPPRGSSSNPDRKKVIELLTKLHANEFEAESVYRDAAKDARRERFTALASSLDKIGDDELEHQRKLKVLIEQMVVY